MDTFAFEKYKTVFYIVYILRLVPGLGENFAGAERGLEEGVRVDEAFPFRTPLWLPILLFPEPDLWEASVTWRQKAKLNLMRTNNSFSLTES